MSGKHEELKRILKLIEKGEISPEEGNLRISNIAKNKINHNETKYYKNGFKSLMIKRPENIDELELVEYKQQELGDYDVEVLVKAFSLNFGDLLCVKGLYPTMPPYPFTPGFETSGIVMRVGKKVTNVTVGEEVIAVMGNLMGGNSEVAVTNEINVVRKPKNISFEEACAFPIVYMTIKHVFEKAKIKKGDKILIQTATGGTGLITVQMAQNLGADIYATAGSEEKLQYLKKLGIKHCINYRKEDFKTRIFEMTNNKGVDVVINTLSGKAIQDGIECLAQNGRYVEIAMTGLKLAKNIDISSMDDNQEFISVDLRKLLKSDVVLAREYMENMISDLEDGMVRPTISKIFNINDIKDAYKCLEDRANIGKVVVTTTLNLELEEKLKSQFKDTAISNRKKTSQKSETIKDDIAVVGLSCRYPQAKNKEEFWDILEKGKDIITDVPKERWDKDKYYSSDVKELDKTNCIKGGFLEDIDKFDALFFNISGKEAELSDPQQRILLEEAYKALEDAGEINQNLENKKCGTFFGVSQGDYQEKMIQEDVPLSPQGFWGNSASISAARIAYYLNLKGPSLAIDTACSSSLVAIHLACKSILNGESDLALAGGINIGVTPRFFVMSSNANMLSPDGKCKTFDKDANGFVPGEGVGVLVLKPLSKAIKDKNNIYSIIKASACNQDGKTNGITAPSSLSQTELEVEVYEKNNINPETISYVEAHGTGTKLGDPIEVEALKNAFSKFTNKKNFCGIGSVKSNIGHTLMAAGVSSVIKVILSMNKKKMPPTLHYHQLNEHISIENSPFYINDKLTEWKVPKDTKRRAAVSSFGFSGTNCHLIVEESPDIIENGISNENECLITISARTQNALKQKIIDLRQWIDNNSYANINDISYTLLFGRNHFKKRISFLVDNIEKLKEKLDKLIFDNNYCAKESTKNSELSVISNRYNNGENIDFKEALQNISGRIISMPTYPFDSRSYWFESQKKSEIRYSNSNDNSLIAENVSTLEGIKYKKCFNGEEFFLSNHIVNGQKTLPATCYIDFVLENLAQCCKKDILELGNILWLRPFSIKDKEKEIYMEVEMVEEKVKYQIYSIEDDSKLIHSVGYASINSDNIDKKFNIEELKDKCIEKIDTNNIYDDFCKIGLKYYDKFRTIRELSISEKEVFSYLKSDLIDNNMKINPALLDGALQTLMGTILKNISDLEGEIYLPYSLGKIRIHSLLKNECYVYARVSNEADKDSKKYDIYLLDSNGNVIVELIDFNLRKINKTNYSVVLGKTKWEKSDILLENKPVNNECVLVLDASDNNISLKEVRNKYNLIHVAKGNDFLKINENEYELDFSNIGSYEKLFAEVNLKEKNISKVLFLESSKACNIDEKIDSSLFSINKLVKTIEGQALKVKFLYAAEQVNDIYGCIDNAVASYFKVVNKEVFNVKCKSVIYEKQYLNLTKIFDEFYESNNWSEEIKYTEDRNIKVLEKYEITDNNNIKLKDNGVYVITGGTGGIGCLIAEYLVQNYNAHVILFGRSVLNNQKLEKIKSINTNNKVEYHEVNICDDFSNEIEQLIAKYNKIDGVFHCAGITEDNYIINKDIVSISKVIEPKIKGSINIFNAIKDKDVEFVVLFSSVASIFGNIGQADYAFANSFMDNYSEFVNNNFESKAKYISINWPLWEEGGMEIKKEMVDIIKNSTGIVPINTKYAMKEIEECIACSESQVLVNYGIEAIINKKIFTTMAKHTKSTIVNREGINTDKVLEKVIDLAASTLKINVTDIEKDNELNEYGFDSLSMTDFAARLSNSFGMNITPANLFEYKTFEELSKYISSNLDDDYILSDNNSEDLKENIVTDTNVNIKEENKTIDFSSQFEKEILSNDKDQKPASDIKKLDIAIIGINGRFPKSPDLDVFWNNLINGVDMISEIPKERWDWHEYYGDPLSEKNKIKVKNGGFIDDVDKFDASFFGISPRDAELMDPQHRLMIESTYSVIEDAGYKVSELAKDKVGVFVGVSSADYGQIVYKDAKEITAQNLLGLSTAMIANRISYIFDFKGPSEPVDTACSSSLVALHNAIESIKKGDCDVAVIGAVNALLSPVSYLSLGKAGMLSEDGKCKTFDEEANGYVRSEGVGTILIKPLNKALEDNDNIYGIIKNSAVNHGGHANSLTAPNPNAQSELIEKVWKDADIDPSTINYIETHGTGTKIGDPIEINALKSSFEKIYKNKNIFNEYTKKSCALGAVKSNIGHLEAAAGMPGLMKILLAMKNKMIPANINLNKVNPYIQLDNSPFYLADKTIEWNRLKDNNGNEIPRRAGLSSFGFGGANVHVAIEEYIDTRKENISINNNIFVLSSKTQDGLMLQAKRYFEFLVKQKNSQMSVKDYIVDKLSTILDVSKTSIEACYVFEECGLEESDYMELVNKINEELDINLKTSIFVQYPQIDSLSNYLEKEYESKISTICNMVQKNIDITDICYTLQLGREVMDYKLALVVNGYDDLLFKLTKFIENDKDNRFIYSGKSSKMLPQNNNIDRIEPDVENLIKIAKMWVDGTDVNWKLLYNNQKIKKISLPTYVFNRKRYWVNSFEDSIKKEIPQNISKHDNKLTDDNITSRVYTGNEVELKVIEESIAIIKMNNKEEKNMFSTNMILGLMDKFKYIEQNENIKAVILTGYDNVFCMGGTLEQLENIAGDKSKFSDVEFLYTGILKCNVPVIAAMQGHAMGGGFLFGLYSDIVIISEECTYTAVFTKYGFTPGMGATYILGEKLGVNNANAMMYTARAFTGKELKENGANVIIKKKSEVFEEALIIARDIAKKPRNTLSVLKNELSKRVLDKLHDIIEAEEKMHSQTFKSDEVKERLKYYLNPKEKENHKESKNVQMPNEYDEQFFENLLDKLKDGKLSINDIV